MAATSSACRSARLGPSHRPDSGTLNGTACPSFINVNHPRRTRAKNADIDYTGTIMPPPGSGVPPLSEDEKMLIARWIDLGAPVDASDAALKPFGWFNDELKPTLHLSLPKAGENTDLLSELRLSAFDNYAGLDRASLSVTANFAVNGKPPGTELAGDFVESDFIWKLNLATPIRAATDLTLNVSVKDLRGNQSAVARTFSVKAGGGGGATCPL
jgi:hypothetical protein